MDLWCLLLFSCVVIIEISILSLPLSFQTLSMKTIYWNLYKPGFKNFCSSWKWHNISEWTGNFVTNTSLGVFSIIFGNINSISVDRSWHHPSVWDVLCPLAAKSSQKVMVWKQPDHPVCLPLFLKGWVKSWVHFHLPQGTIALTYLLSNFDLRCLKSKLKKHSVKLEIFVQFLNLIHIIENMLLLTVGTAHHVIYSKEH